jgi:hypothetical protein
MATLTQTKPQTTSQPTHQPDRIDAQFDAAIGLPPQSQSPEYLNAYYGSGHVPF